MIVRMIVRMIAVGMLIVASDSPGHPERKEDYDYPGGHLHPGLDVFRLDLFLEQEGQGHDDPDDHRVRKGGGQTQQDGLLDGTPDGDDERRHHRFGMSGFETMQGPQNDGRRKIQPTVGQQLSGIDFSNHARTVQWSWEAPDFKMSALTRKLPSAA